MFSFFPPALKGYDQHFLFISLNIVEGFYFTFKNLRDGEWRFACPDLSSGRWHQSSEGHATAGKTRDVQPSRLLVFY